jgi:hypothetical protein
VTLNAHAGTVKTTAVHVQMCSGKRVTNSAKQALLKPFQGCYGAEDVQIRCFWHALAPVNVQKMWKVHALISAGYWLSGLKKLHRSDSQVVRGPKAPCGSYGTGPLPSTLNGAVEHYLR